MITEWFICAPSEGACPRELRELPASQQKYVHVLVDLLGDFVQVVCCHAGDPLSQFFGLHSAFVIHQVVGDGLGDVVLGLVVQHLVVDSALGPLQLLVGDFVGVGCVIVGVQA